MTPPARMSIRELFRGAWGAAFRSYPWFLAGFAGIVAAWLLVEWIVILSPLAGNRAVWWLAHVGYFFLTAVPETALLRLADNVAAGRAPNHTLRPGAAAVVRYTLLKFALVPAFLVGLALLVLPGLWLGYRLLFSGFALAVESRPLAGAIERSLALTRRGAGHGMLLVLVLTLFNLLGLAVLGVGLLLTAPPTYVVLARAWREARR